MLKLNVSYKKHNKKHLCKNIRGKKMGEKYTAEVSAMRVVERIKYLLARGTPTPLKREWIIKGFGGTLWNARENAVIDFDAGFNYLSRCRAIKIINVEEIEITEYFDLFGPKPHYPQPLPVQIERQIESEAENMQHCYYWLYTFENTLRNFIQTSLSERYGERWYDELTKRVRKEIEENRKKWHGGIPERNPLEFTSLRTLHTIILNKWEDIFKGKFKAIDPTSLRESLDRIEAFRNTIAHSRMLSDEESKVFYYEIKNVLSSIKLFR
jgi:hypothetical protein